MRYCDRGWSRAVACNCGRTLYYETHADRVFYGNSAAGRGASLNLFEYDCYTIVCDTVTVSEVVPLPVIVGVHYTMKLTLIASSMVMRLLEDGLVWTC